MAEYGLIKDDTMTAIAAAIREKGGAESSLLPSAMPDAIRSISGGGGGSLLDAAIQIINAGAGCYTNSGYGRRSHDAVIGKHYLVVTGHSSSTSGQEFVSSASLAGCTVLAFNSKGSTTSASGGTRYLTMAVIEATATSVTSYFGGSGELFIPLD